MPQADIEHLYHVFARYHAPRRLEGCPCCTSPSEAEHLRHKPLRTITSPELEHYAFKALSTWGTLKDYKYFLPRILELTDDQSLRCDTEITLRKLAYGDFANWPADERSAIQVVIGRMWRDRVRAHDLWAADAVLCGAASVIDDVSPLLQDADVIAPDFRAWYAIEHSDQTKRKLRNSFWDRGARNYVRVVSWLYPQATTAA